MKLRDAREGLDDATSTQVGTSHVGNNSHLFTTLDNPMKSPFPGFDPFLEAEDVFPDFHDAFLAAMRETLQAKLPEPYYAGLGRRAWVEISERFIGPDVNVVRLQRRPEPERSHVATLERAASTPVVIHVPHDEYKENLVEICIGRGANRRLVTSIELLSYSNKTPGRHGRDLYLRKQNEVLGSQTHLIEIDFLRGGTHTTAVPIERLRAAVECFDYHVCLHRSDAMEDYYVYPILLPDALPTVQVPLLAGEGEVELELQQVFERTYSAGPYSREIEYSPEMIVPPLPEEYADWARALLHEYHSKNNANKIK